MKREIPKAKDEIACYFNESFLQRKEYLNEDGSFNPLFYWKENEKKYRVISKVASWILSSPCSSVRSEEAFSAANWMINYRRTQLKPKNVDKTMFVKSFYCQN